MGDVRLIRIAGLYLYVNRGDWPYGRLMADPRSREVAEAEADPLWVENDMAPAPTWDAGKKDLPFAAWASLHCHRVGLDFDFLDIGANIGMEGIGQATLNKRCGWKNKVYLFEPGDIFELVARSVERNRVGDIATVVHAALSDQVRRERFYFLPRSSGGSSLLPEKVFGLSHRQEIEEIEVETTTVDRFVRDHMRPAPALIAKVDTEGVDFKVLAGMRETMKDRMVIAQIELIPGLVETYASPTERLKELAQSFILINAGPGQRKRLVPSSEIEAFVEDARHSVHPPDVCMIPRHLPKAADLLENILCG